MPGRAPQQPAVQLGTLHPQQPQKMQVDANMEDIKYGDKVASLTANPSCRGTARARLRHPLQRSKPRRYKHGRFTCC